MNIKLTCPVCGHKEIEGDICPNCDTDLSLLRLLAEIPPSNPQSQKQRRQKIAGWHVAVAGLIFMIGIGLGVVGSSLFLQPPQLLTNTVNPASPANRDESATPSPIARNAPMKPQQPFSGSTQYTVRRKDNLTAIAERFCGKGKSWQLIVEANPQIKGRENSIEVGEVLKIPNCN